jgi:hypothetical protein
VTQFPWYQYPANAQTIDFNVIFQDFYQQSIQGATRARAASPAP